MEDKKKRGAQSRIGGDHGHAIAPDSSFMASAGGAHAWRGRRSQRSGRPRAHEDARGGGVFGGRPVALVRSQVVAGREGPARRRRGDHRQGQEHRPRRQPARAAQPDHRRQAQLLGRQGPRAQDRVDLPAGRRARHRQRESPSHPQSDDHPDRQRQGREHQHHGRPRHHAREGYP
jgi:hypothetical protein